MFPSIAYVATYPPRRCGIATFTHDLRSAVGASSSVFALGSVDGNSSEAVWLDPPEVRAVLEDHAPEAYRRIGVAIDGSGANVVSLQHEFGIFGGQDGSRVLDLVERLETPLVTTFHTVVPEPGDRRRSIIRGVAAASAAVVVMSESARHLLGARYGVDLDRIRVIPHGVPDLPAVLPEVRKAEFGLTGRPTVLSFGLIGPGKGYELAIEAMAGVRRRVPDAVYVILGTTHPELLRREGTRYLDQLRRQAEELDLTETVRFEDRFVGPSELGRRLQASDAFVTPYPNLDQIVSGTLSYALGAGLAIVSTPYLYAREVLAEGRGVLVPSASPDAMAAALTEILTDEGHRAELRRRAHALGRRMIWPEVGRSYRELFAEVAADHRRVGGRRREAESIHA